MISLLLWSLSGGGRVNKKGYNILILSLSRANCTDALFWAISYTTVWQAIPGGIFWKLFRRIIFWFMEEESLISLCFTLFVFKSCLWKNREFRKRSWENLVESEKQFFEKLKHRGDVYDPFTKVLYEIQRDAKAIEKKKGIFYKSKDVELIKFNKPRWVPRFRPFWGDINKNVEGSSKVCWRALKNSGGPTLLFNIVD